MFLQTGKGQHRERPQVKSEGQSEDLVRLPAKVVQRILGYLEQEDLARVVKVCRIFYELATPALYRSVVQIPNSRDAVCGFQLGGGGRVSQRQLITWAILSDRRSALKHLFANGGDPNLAVSNPNSHHRLALAPLHLAVNDRCPCDKCKYEADWFRDGETREDIVQLLLESGADIYNEACIFTPLEWAIMNDHDTIVAAMLETQPLRDYPGRIHFYLYVACQSLKPQVLNHMLRYGNIGAGYRDENGNGLDIILFDCLEPIREAAVMPIDEVAVRLAACVDVIDTFGIRLSDIVPAGETPFDYYEALVADDEGQVFYWALRSRLTWDGRRLQVVEDFF